MAKFTIGVPKNGGFTFDGMEMADVFKPVIEESANEQYMTYITTASEQLIEDLFFSFRHADSNGIAEQILSGNHKKAEDDVKYRQRKMVQGLANRDIFKSYGSAWADEHGDSYFGGATPMQKINRSNRVVLDDALVNTWRSHFG